MKDWLLTNIESASDFRAEKAKQYPDDARNAASAEALRGLHDYIAALPDDHPVFASVDLSSVDDGSADIQHSEEVNATLGRYGYDGAEDHESFVRWLVALPAQILRAADSPSSMIH